MHLFSINLCFGGSYAIVWVQKIVTKDVGAPPVDVARELIWVKTNRTKREVYAHEKEIETREKAFQKL